MLKPCPAHIESIRKPLTIAIKNLENGRSADIKDLEKLADLALTAKLDHPEIRDLGIKAIRLIRANLNEKIKYNVQNRFDPEMLDHALKGSIPFNSQAERYNAIASYSRGVANIAKEIEAYSRLAARISSYEEPVDAPIMS